MPVSYCLSFTVSGIPDPGSRSFVITGAENTLEGFVVRKGHEVFAYRNCCPHTGVSLNWSEDVFLDIHQEFIQCSMHGALFTVETGHCIRGPCAGQSLQRLELTVTSKDRIMIRV